MFLSLPSYFPSSLLRAMKKKMTLDEDKKAKQNKFLASRTVVINFCCLSHSVCGTSCGSLRKLIQTSLLLSLLNLPSLKQLPGKTSPNSRMKLYLYKVHGFMFYSEVWSLFQQILLKSL